MAPEQLLPTTSPAAPSASAPAVPTPSAADLTAPVPTPTTGLEGAGGTGGLVPDTTTGTEPLQRLVDGVLESARDALGSLGTVWDGSSGRLEESAVAQVAGPLAWYLTAAAVVAVLVAGGRLAWQRRGAPARELLVALITLVLVTGAGTATVALAVVAADGLAGSLLGVVTDDPTAALTDLVGLDALGGTAPVTALLLGSGLLLAVLALVAVLVARVVGLVVLTGVLPVSAAAVNTGPGRAAASRLASWLAALVLCQPAAALVLAAGIAVVPALPGAEDPAVRTLAGTVVLLLAALALPACAAALRPAVAVVVTRGSGGAAPVTLPTGAIRLPRGAAPAGTARSVAVRGGPTGSPGVVDPVRPTVRGGAAVTPLGRSAGRTVVSGAVPLVTTTNVPGQARGAGETW